MTATNSLTASSQSEKNACIIWMHGLGADAEDMKGLAAYLNIAPFQPQHLFLEAPLRPITINQGYESRGWYDITGFDRNAREDEQGIRASQLFIEKKIQHCINEGFKSEQIFLAGFSQGGAMALYTALHWPQKLGGVIALSSYLPLSSQITACLDPKTPFFLGLGLLDPIVLPVWTKESVMHLETKGYKNLSVKEYPIDHSISPQEIADLSSWLLSEFKEKP